MFLRSFRTAVSLVVLSSALTTVNAISDEDFHANIAHHNARLQTQRDTEFPSYLNLQMLKERDAAKPLAPHTVLIASGSDYLSEEGVLKAFFAAHPNVIFRLDLKASDVNRRDSRSFFDVSRKDYRSLPRYVFMSNISGDISQIDSDVTTHNDRVVVSDTVTSLTLIDFPELTKIGKSLMGRATSLEHFNLVNLPKLEEVGVIFEGCAKLNRVDLSNLSDTVKFDTFKGFCGSQTVTNFITPSPCGSNLMTTLSQVNESKRRSTLTITLGNANEAAQPAAKEVAKKAANAAS